ENIAGGHGANINALMCVGVDRYGLSVNGDDLKHPANVRHRSTQDQFISVWNWSDCAEIAQKTFDSRGDVFDILTLHGHNYFHNFRASSLGQLAQENERNHVLGQIDIGREHRDHRVGADQDMLGLEDQHIVDEIERFRERV